MKPDEFKEEAMPSLVRIEEFLKSISRDYPIESLGGFVYYAQKTGTPKKWPYSMWNNLLQEYLTKKV